jgi:hypothetical protein
MTHKHDEEIDIGGTDGKATASYKEEFEEKIEES